LTSIVKTCPSEHRTCSAFPEQRESPGISLGFPSGRDEQSETSNADARQPAEINDQLLNSDGEQLVKLLAQFGASGDVKLAGHPDTAVGHNTDSTQPSRTLSVGRAPSSPDLPRDEASCHLAAGIRRQP
jgi:hypothetical protein